MRDILNRFEKLKVAVVGDLILDRYVWGEVSRVSPEAPVPVVRVKNKNTKLGGAGNTAQVIKAVGAEVTLFGRLGGDSGGAEFTELLNEQGIALQRLPNRVEHPTTVKTRVIAESQHVVRIDEEKRSSVELSELRPLENHLEKQLAGCDAILFSDYGKGVFSVENLKLWMDLVERLDKPLVVDPYIEHFFSYRGATLLTPNEAEFLAGMRVRSIRDVDLEELSRRALSELQIGALLITRGEDGMNLIEPDRPVFHLETEAREVYDVTGAGDTVAGFVSLGEALGLERKKSIGLANIAAGIAVGRMGTAVVTSDEIRKEL